MGGFDQQDLSKSAFDLAESVKRRAMSRVRVIYRRLKLYLIKQHLIKKRFYTVVYRFLYSPDRNLSLKSYQKKLSN